MKSCEYCGRESPDDNTHCGECGTRLTEPRTKPISTKTADRRWLHLLGRFLLIVGVVNACGVIYLLSFGPVVRYSCKVKVTKPLSATPSVSQDGHIYVATTVTSVSYPRWVGIVYRPAVLLRENESYNHYLELWQRE